MLHHHSGRGFSRGEAQQRPLGSIEIQQIIEAQGLALQLQRCPPAMLWLAKPISCLVGVFAVAQTFAQGQAKLQLRWFPQLSCKPGADGSVVGGGVAEGFKGKFLTFLKANGPGCQEGFVLVGIG